MDYKIRKTLKDAGFPSGKELEHPIEEFRDWIPPTLSELIEACGDEFVSLEKEYWGNVIMYKATGYDELRDADKSPEVAVAKLWLKLNERNSKK